MSFLSKTDPQIDRVLHMEEKRQRETINLIPSENYASKAVLEAQGSFLTSKYAEGYPDYATMVVVRIWTLSKTWLFSGLKSYFRLSTLMSSHTAELKPTWQPTMP
jgi:hypothetical protein